MDLELERKLVTGGEEKSILGVRQYCCNKPQDQTDEDIESWATKDTSSVIYSIRPCKTNLS